MKLTPLQVTIIIIVMILSATILACMKVIDMATVTLVITTIFAWIAPTPLKSVAIDKTSENQAQNK